MLKSFIVSLAALGLAAPALAEGPPAKPATNIVGAWTVTSAAGGKFVTVMHPNGTFDNYLLEPGQQPARAWGKYTIEVLSPTQVRVEHEGAGWLPETLCDQNRKNCRPYTWTFTPMVATIVDHNTLDVSGTLLHRGPVPSWTKPAVPKVILVHVAPPPRSVAPGPGASPAQPDNGDRDRRNKRFHDEQCAKKDLQEKRICTINGGHVLPYNDPDCGVISHCYN